MIVRVEPVATEVEVEPVKVVPLLPVEAYSGDAHIPSHPNVPQPIPPAAVVIVVPPATIELAPPEAPFAALKAPHPPPPPPITVYPVITIAPVRVCVSEE